MAATVLYEVFLGVQEAPQLQQWLLERSYFQSGIEAGKCIDTKLNRLKEIEDGYPPAEGELQGILRTGTEAAELAVPQRDAHEPTGGECVAQEEELAVIPKDTKNVEEQPRAHPDSRESSTSTEVLLHSQQSSETSVSYSVGTKLTATVVVLVDLVLRSVAQTYAMNHPLTGILLIVGLFLSDLQLPAFGVLGAAVSNAAAVAFGSKRMKDGDFQMALYGYDGVLAALSVRTFLLAIPLGWQYFTAVAVSVMAGTLRCTVGRLVKPLGLFPLTLAFCLTAISMMLIHNFVPTLSFVQGAASPSAAGNTTLTPLPPVTGTLFVKACFKGVGQIMFITDWVGGLLATIALGVCTRRAAVGAFLGAAIANGLAMILLPYQTNAVVSTRLIEGLYAYNSALTACVIAGGTVPLRKSKLNLRDNFLFPTLGAFMAFPLHLTWQALLSTPVMTVPFITTTWILHPAFSSLTSTQVAQTEILKISTLLRQKHQTSSLGQKSVTTSLDDMRNPHLGRNPLVVGLPNGHGDDEPPVNRVQSFSQRSVGSRKQSQSCKGDDPVVIEDFHTGQSTQLATEVFVTSAE